MIIYLDLVFLLNLFFNSILLFSVSIILKRKTNIRKILLSSFIGSFSILLLFININSLCLFIFKIFIALIMILISFSYRDIRYTIRNMFYLYTTSIILGGFLYLINIEYNYKNDGIIFYSNGLSINFLLLIILSPIILYAYTKQITLLKNNYSNYYKAFIYFNNGHVIETISFLDTGNNLFDPYKNRPIVLINRNMVNNQYDEEDMLLVPYDTIDNHGLLKCLKIDKINIIGIGIKRNVLVGISSKQIKIDGVDLILNKVLLEGK